MRKNDHNLKYWLRSRNNNLMELDIPAMGPQPDGAVGAPMSQPGTPDNPMGNMNLSGSPIDQMANNMSKKNPFDEEDDDDISDDPNFPEMPEDKEEDITKDFELWRQKYIDESVKGDPNNLIDMILAIRDRNLEPNQWKFVEDNLQINMLRQTPTIFQTSSSFRRNVKRDMDRNLPATSIIKYLAAALDENPLVSDIFIKLLGGLGAKQDWHRKFISALLGGVQVGSGAINEDIIFQESDYSVPISTRFNTKWGDVVLGSWELTEGDPERFLKSAELDRLHAGSPEERDVLRRRVVLESIADKFKQRSFVITTVGTDGTINHLGLDLGNCLQSGYLDGRLVVRSENSDARRIFISDDGEVISIPELTIYYVKRVKDIFSNSSVEEIEFIRHREGKLFLSAQADLLLECSSTLQGLVFKDVPWRGNPKDFTIMSRCVPSVEEILNRRCQ